MGRLINEATINQNNIIRAHLITHGWIDKKTALQICDCERISARIYDLRHDYGMDIVTERVAGKNRFGHAETHAIYRLKKE
jgi:hypothetical protein